jgi:hypothetical protein
MRGDSIRPVELTVEDRHLLLRLVRSYAKYLSYGIKYHDDVNFPGGPPDWPTALRKVNTLVRKLQGTQVAGGLSWPDDSPQGTTPTAPTAKT